MKKITAILAFLMLAFLTNQAEANSMTVSQYKEFNKDPSELNVYLQGVVDGIFWTDSAFSTLHKVKLYCPPRDLNLNNYKNILNDELKTGIDSDDSLIFPILLRGLAKTFPCE